MGIKQEQGEPLRAFIDRFSKAALRTPHLNQEMILQCMTLTLQPGPFANNVYLHPPASMHELKLRAADYVRMEEMQTLHAKFCNDYAATTANPNPPPPALIPDHKSPANPALPDMLPLTSPNPASLMRPCKLASSHHHARRPLPPMLIWPNIAATTATLATLQKTVKHSRIKLKNWFLLVTFAASSAEMIIPLEPVTPLDLTTDALHTTLATTNALPNPPTKILNRLALMLPLPILPYVALSRYINQASFKILSHVYVYIVVKIKYWYIMNFCPVQKYCPHMNNQLK